MRFPLQTHSIPLHMHNCTVMQLFSVGVLVSATHWAMEVSERQEDIFAVDQESPLAPPLPMREKYNSVIYNCTFVHLYMSK